VSLLFGQIKTQQKTQLKTTKDKKFTTNQSITVAILVGFALKMDTDFDTYYNTHSYLGN
jgi:hypothetical protein